MPRRSLFWLLALLGVAVAGCGAGGHARPVALAADTPIESRPLDEWTGIELAAGRAGNRAQARQLALGLLISWGWAKTEARALKVEVSDREAGEQLGQLRYTATRGSFDGELRPGERALRPFIVSSGISSQAQLEVVRMWLLGSRLAQRRIAALARAMPRSRVSSFYEHHLRRFLEGERRDIEAIINFSRAKVEEAKRELEAGVSFGVVARRFNQSFEGGLLVNDPRGPQEKRLEWDYFSAPPHVLIGPLKEWLWYVFEVLRIRPAHPRPLADVEASIRRTLAARQDATTLAARERGWRERTVCRSGYAASRCGRYEAELNTRL